MLKVSVKCGKCHTTTQVNPAIVSLYKFRCYMCGLEADFRYEAEQIIKAEDALKKLRKAEVSLSVELKTEEV